MRVVSLTLVTLLRHHYSPCKLFDVDVFGFFVKVHIQNIEYMEYMVIEKVLFYYSQRQK